MFGGKHIPLAQFLAVTIILLFGCLHAAHAQTTINLKDFGATGDGTTDDGPALQSALDALADAGGGTLFVPEGSYAIVTPVSKDFSGLATSIVIAGVESSTVVDTTGDGLALSRGLDLVSEFLPRTGSADIAISLSGLQSFLIHDMTFMGTPIVSTDAYVTLNFYGIEDAIIRHCEFYGLSSQIAGGAIVRSIHSYLRIEQTKFLGSTGHSAVYVPVVENLEWRGVAVRDTVFLDYGQRPELFTKTSMGAPIGWISIGNPEIVTNNSPRREVIVDTVFLDEGALYGILVVPDRYAPPPWGIDLIYVTGMHMNVSNLGTSGNFLSKPKAVLIESSRYQWSHNADCAINLRGVQRAVIDRAECVAHADTIRADAATVDLTVIDSIYTNLASEAQTTLVVNTENAGEDAVQYVREQYAAVLGRAPDAAAHYYWSTLQLDCGNDNGCINNRRAQLDSYLQSSPNATFTLQGQVTVDDNAPLAAALIALNGSQSVTTTTDADGHYIFSNLPTSGDYTIAVSKTHYTFGASVIAVTTPASDQIVNVAGLVNRYEISGHIADAAGHALANASLTLSGSDDAITTTDNDGNYSFAGLAAGGTYTVTPSNGTYIFAPQSQSFSDLSSNKAVNFTLVTHRISGRVLKPDGSPIATAILDLSGGANISTTTDANGYYNIADLPASVDYTVTVSHVRYTFSSSAISVNALALDETVNFTGAPVKFNISGRITADNAPLAGVMVTLSGSQSAITTTDADGAYLFEADAEGSYTVSPSLAHYTFSPALITVASLIDNQTGEFTAALNRHAITGRVSDFNNNGISGVQIELTGFTNATTSTVGNGQFSFPALAEGQTYTVAPKLKYYAFDKAALTFNNLTSDQFAGFILGPAHYAITGRITRSDGAPMAGVNVTLSGPQSAATMSDASGNYFFSNLPAGNNYHVSASKMNYDFSPGDVAVDLDKDRQANFTGAVLTFKISGHVIQKGVPLQGVTMTIAGSQTTTTTDSHGAYSIDVSADDTYTITPSRANFTFTPSSSTYTNLSGNRAGDFAAVLNFGVPVLISDASSTRAIAFDTVLRSVEPFDLGYDYGWSLDKRTRLTFFAMNFELAAGETAANITADAEDSTGRVYNLPVEYARKDEGQEWLMRIVVRLDHDLTNAGDVLLRIKHQGTASNRVRVGIGYVGGGPPDDQYSTPTPGIRP